MSIFDGMDFEQATKHLLSRCQQETTVSNEIRYKHFRVWDFATGTFSPKGGVTVAYKKIGEWYAVGAAFCGLMDTYQKSGTVKKCIAKVRHEFDKDGNSIITPAEYAHSFVGATLAIMRLDHPAYIHAVEFEQDGPTASVFTIAAQSEAERFWLDRALSKGLGYTWELRTIGSMYKKPKVLSPDVLSQVTNAIAGMVRKQ